MATSWEWQVVLALIKVVLKILNATRAQGIAIVVDTVILEEALHREEVRRKDVRY